jgi:hypothetical protein
MKQAGQSKEMAEARLSFEELGITILIPSLRVPKMYTDFKKGKNTFLEEIFYIYIYITYEISSRNLLIRLYRF